jgi:membrane-associated phospholipid phosphatase
MCLAAVIAAGVLLRSVALPLDVWIVDNLYLAPGTAGAGVATAISAVGTLACMAALLAGAVMVWRRRGAGLVLRASLMGVLCGSVMALQPLILRPGPPLQPQAGTYPSGHATVVTAIVFTAIVLYGSLGRGWRSVAVVAGGFAVVLVSASRVVLAEHWLVDVVAAAVATVGVGLVAMTALRVRARRPGMV